MRKAEMYVHFRYAAAPYRIKPGKVMDFIEKIRALAIRTGSGDSVLDCIDLEGRDEKLAKRIIYAVVCTVDTAIELDVVWSNPLFFTPIRLSIRYNDGTTSRLAAISKTNTVVDI
jgi:hypothetical protein